MAIQPRKLPSIETLERLLDFNPETGTFIWKKRSPSDFVGKGGRRAQHNCRVFNSRFAGQPALCQQYGNRYLGGSIQKVQYGAHRVAYKMYYKREPEFVDHINGRKHDNRPENLRSVSWVDNCRNITLPSDNTSGAIGVKNHGKYWSASIGHEGKSVYLGRYPKFEMALIARRAAEKVLGYHPNHGKPRKVENAYSE